MANEKKRKNEKEVLAVSRGTYKGVTIYETPKGFAVALGMLVYVSNALSSITGFIDAWFEMRKN